MHHHSLSGTLNDGFLGGRNDIRYKTSTFVNKCINGFSKYLSLECWVRPDIIIGSFIKVEGRTRIKVYISTLQRQRKASKFMLLSKHTNLFWVRTFVLRYKGQPKTRYLVLIFYTVQPSPTSSFQPGTYKAT